jgi:hypothetical protein
MKKIESWCVGVLDCRLQAEAAGSVARAHYLQSAVESVDMRTVMVEWSRTGGADSSSHPKGAVRVGNSATASQNGGRMTRYLLIIS